MRGRIEAPESGRIARRLSGFGRVETDRLDLMDRRWAGWRRRGAGEATGGQDKSTGTRRRLSRCLHIFFDVPRPLGRGTSCPIRCCCRFSSAGAAPGKLSAQGSPQPRANGLVCWFAARGSPSNVRSFHGQRPTGDRTGREHGGDAGRGTKASWCPSSTTTADSTLIRDINELLLRL